MRGASSGSGEREISPVPTGHTDTAVSHMFVYVPNHKFFNKSCGKAGFRVRRTKSFAKYQFMSDDAATIAPDGDASGKLATPTIDEDLEELLMEEIWGEEEEGGAWADVAAQEPDAARFEREWRTAGKAEARAATLAAILTHAQSMPKTKLSHSLATASPRKHPRTCVTLVPNAHHRTPTAVAPSRSAVALRRTAWHSLLMAVRSCTSVAMATRPL